MEHMTKRLIFSAFLALLGGAAYAEGGGTSSWRHKTCPADFDVVDLGRWTTNDEGKSVRAYGGILYKVTPTGPTWQDMIWCIPPEDLDGQVQLLDGKPVPLVQSYRDGDLGLRYIQKPYGDYVRDIVAGYVMVGSPQGPLEARVEDENRKGFLASRETAKDRGKVVSSGENFTCVHAPEVPTQSEHPSYGCLVTLDGAPFPDTHILCGRWVGGCSAEFSVTQDLSIWLRGDSIDRLSEAPLAESMPDALEYWSALVRASIENFEANVVPRGREVFTGGGD